MPVHVPQHARPQVALPAERVDQLTLVIERHRVDRQIAAAQVLLERHIGGGVHDETAIARSRLALGSGQRVLLVGLRMKKHREVPADGSEAERKHLIRCAADDHPIAIALAVRPPQQLVAHPTADRVDLHQRRARAR